MANKKVNLQCKHLQYAGMTISTIIGEVKLDEDGVFEVDEKKAKELLNASEDFEALDELSEDEEDDLGDDEKSKLLEQLESMSVDEMIALCKETGVKGFEKFKKNEKALRTYIKKQIEK